VAAKLPASRIEADNDDDDDDEDDRVGDVGVA